MHWGNGRVLKRNGLNYIETEIVDGLSARHCVKFEDEWLCEAYMQTDYTKLTQNDFQATINDYLAYLVKSGEVYEN